MLKVKQKMTLYTYIRMITCAREILVQVIHQRVRFGWLCKGLVLEFRSQDGYLPALFASVYAHMPT